MNISESRSCGRSFRALLGRLSDLGASTWAPPFVRFPSRLATFWERLIQAKVVSVVCRPALCHCHGSGLPVRWQWQFEEGSVRASARGAGVRRTSSAAQLRACGRLIVRAASSCVGPSDPLRNHTATNTREVVGQPVGFERDPRQRSGSSYLPTTTHPDGEQKPSPLPTVGSVARYYPIRAQVSA